MTDLRSDQTTMFGPTDDMYILARVVEWIDRHLDADVSAVYHEQPLAQDWARVSKVVEEAGEAVDALIGMTGQNPRKGPYAGESDLLAELADTALCGLYAMQHFTKDVERTIGLLMDRAVYHRNRVEQS